MCRSYRIIRRIEVRDNGEGCREEILAWQDRFTVYNDIEFRLFTRVIDVEWM